jgi:hypothetical protein
MPFSILPIWAALGEPPSILDNCQYLSPDFLICSFNGCGFMAGISIDFSLLMIKI